jgi:hypothetical protein
VVLCGGSAGALCWFSHGLSGFHEGPARNVQALGLLPWTGAVHLYEEAGRRESLTAAVGGGCPTGFGAGDSAALHFIGTELFEVVSSRPQARAAHVSLGPDGVPVEHELPVRYLGADSAADAHEPEAARAIAA